MKIHQKKIDKEHTDSYWYSGGIASIGKYYLVATGLISLNCNCDPANDKQLKKCYDNDHFNNNNWFEVIDDKTGESVLGDVVYNYDEAIDLLKQYHKERVYN